jgi:hypothetical protein
MDITTNIPKDISEINHSSLNFEWGLFLSIIFICLTFSIIVVIVIYQLYWRPSIPAKICQQDNNCDINQICQLGICTEKRCNSNSDCQNNSICLNTYCTSFNCITGNDCPTGTACDNTSCIQVGQSCQSNIDCFSSLSCLNQICAQCLTNSNCPTGQGCFNNICRYPYQGETGPTTITFISPAQTNGNITAPPAYFCSSVQCGTGMNTQSQISCDNDQYICPNSCPFCVNSVCRCTSGQNFETCRSNSDCSSGLCSTTENGKICVPIGGECIFNHNESQRDNIKVCPVSKPYCVNGTCSSVSLGAFCGSTGLPYDLCNNPQSLGVTGMTGITQDGMGFFCVNGTCQQNPGNLNDLCTPGSCSFIEDGAFVCTPINTTSIPLMRCLKIDS